MSQVISQVLSKVEVLVRQARQHEEQLASIVQEISQLTGNTASLTVTPNLEAQAKRRGRPPGSSKKIAVAISGDISNVVPKRRGRPPGSGKKAVTVPTLTATGKRRGRPPGSGKKVAPPLSAMPTPAPVSASAPTIHLLPTVIWEILNRGELEWRKALPELPEDVTGLKATELLHIIQQEMALSNDQTGDLATQISASLRKLSNLKTIVRGDHSRYSIEANAKEPTEEELAVEVETTEE